MELVNSSTTNIIEYPRVINELMLYSLIIFPPLYNIRAYKMLFNANTCNI
jgi:hypothetical protein